MRNLRRFSLLVLCFYFCAYALPSFGGWTQPRAVYAQGNNPAGFMFQSVSYAGERLCPLDTLVFKLIFIAVAAPDGSPYNVSVAIPVPTDTNFDALAGDDAELGDDDVIRWSFPVDPTSDASIVPTLTFSATVGRGTPDGTVIESLANAQTDDDRQLAARAAEIVHCDPDSEPPRDSGKYPQLPGLGETPQDVAGPDSSAAMLASDFEPGASGPANESVLEDFAMGDLAPPGYVPTDEEPDDEEPDDEDPDDEDPDDEDPDDEEPDDEQPHSPAASVFLPLLNLAGVQASSAQQPANLDVAEEVFLAAADAGEQAGRACADVYPWVSRHGMSEAVYMDDGKLRDGAGFRPIAVSVNGAGADTRFATLWVKDGLYGKNWRLSHSLDKDTYVSHESELKALGLRPIVIDLYGTTADPRFAGIWVQDNLPYARLHNADGDEMQAMIDASVRRGLSTGLGIGAGQSQRRRASLWRAVGPGCLYGHHAYQSHTRGH